MFIRDLTVNWAPKVSALFGRSLEKQNWRWMIPPGDVYVCSPDCHEEDKQNKILTIIWCPIK